MKEGLFLSLLALSGYGLFTRLFQQREVFYAAAVAVPFGMLMWAATQFVLLIVGLPLVGAFGVIGIFCAYCVWDICRKRGQGALLPALVITSIALTVGVVASKVGAIQVSFDSIEQIAIGRTLNMMGVSGTLGMLLASWGALLLLVHGAGALIGVEVLLGLQPLTFLSLTGILIASGWRLSAHDWTKTLFNAVLIVLLASTWFLVFQAVYIHNSLISATFLLVFASSIKFALRDGRDRWLSLAFLGLLGFAIARTESPLFAALALLIVSPLFTDGSLSRHFRRLTLLYSVAVIAWCIALVGMIGVGSEIMTPSRIAVLIAAQMGTMLAIIYGPRLVGGYYKTWLPTAVVAVSTLALSLTYILGPAEFAHNVLTIGGNLLINGRWGASWYVLLAVLPLLLAFRSTRLSRVLVAYIFVFVCLIVVMGLMRIPYRVGWGDSANRMMTHIYPIAVLACMIMVSREEVAAVLQKGGRLLGLRSFLLAAIITGWVSLSAASLSWQPLVPGSEIIVKDAQGFCPPDNSGRHTFEVALGGGPPDAYAAACVQGPLTVLLELKRPREIQWIEIEEYSADQQWRDFSVSFSEDGKQWATVSSNGNSGNADAITRIDSTRWLVRAPAHLESREIRIEFRSSTGQNRMLLKNIKFFE